MPAPATITLSPHFREPGIIMPTAQASHAFELLGGRGPMIKLGEGDLVVYAARLDIRTRMASGQSAANQLPGIAIAPGLLSTATYLNRVRAEWDHHDISAYARNWNINLQAAYSLGLRQAHVQIERTALLYGMNPANGEGLINTAGSYTVTLPADTNGHTNVSLYDPGQLAQWLIQQVISLKTRTNQLGQPKRIVMVGPQRTLGWMEGEIVQVTSFQRPGAGSATTRMEFEKVLSEAGGDVITWGYDDTLIGKGAGGTDMIMLVMPDIEPLHGPAGQDTNVFGGLEPGLNFTTAMYQDMPAPREIMAPLTAGATDLVSEKRTTSGWGLRPEAVTLISAAY